MGKTLAGVKYGKMTSAPKTPHKSKSQAKMHGRSGPPMVNIGKGGSKRPALGSVSTRKGNTGPSSTPTIGRQSGHGTWASMGIKKSA